MSPDKLQAGNNEPASVRGGGQSESGVSALIAAMKSRL
jgi:hypothetical protein